MEKIYIVTQKEGGPTKHIAPSTAFNKPLTPNLILIYNNAYKSPNFLTPSLSTDSGVCTPRIINTQHTQQQNKLQRTPTPALLLSHTQLPAENILILHCRLFTLRKHKLSFHPSSQNSKPSNHCPTFCSL